MTTVQGFNIPTHWIVRIDLTEVEARTLVHALNATMENRPLIDDEVALVDQLWLVVGESLRTIDES